MKNCLRPAALSDHTFEFWDLDSRAAMLVRLTALCRLFQAEWRKRGFLRSP